MNYERHQQSANDDRRGRSGGYYYDDQRAYSSLGPETRRSPSRCENGWRSRSPTAYRYAQQPPRPRSRERESERPYRADIRSGQYSHSESQHFPNRFTHQRRKSDSPAWIRENEREHANVVERNSGGECVRELSNERSRSRRISDVQRNKRTSNAAGGGDFYDIVPGSSGRADACVTNSCIRPGFADFIRGLATSQVFVPVDPVNYDHFPVCFFAALL